jgi:AraC-like DNA-binding protein
MTLTPCCCKSLTSDLAKVDSIEGLKEICGDSGSVPLILAANNAAMLINGLLGGNYHFLIIFFNYLPFYFLPIAEKAIIVKSIANDISLAGTYKFGIIPEKLFFILVPILATYYVILQWRLISKFKKTNQQVEVQNQINIVIKWIKIFTSSSTFFVVGYFILIYGFLYIPNFMSSSSFYIIPGLILSSSFLVVSSYLLVNPYVLSGLSFIKYREIESSILVNEIKEIPFIETDFSKEIKLIDDYFIQKHSFLIQGLNISMVAVELNIPLRDLSYIINNYYTTRFNDFVNKYRIEYILNKMNIAHLDMYTLESLSKEAGFSHKSSFYRAFKKIYNVTPLEYLKN